VYKPLIYSSKVYIEVRFPEWRKEAFLELRFRGKTFPERTLERIPMALEKSFNMGEMEATGAFIDVSTLTDASGKNTNTRRLAVYERNDVDRNGEERRSMSVPSATADTDEMDTLEGSHVNGTDEPASPRFLRRKVHNVFTEHGCQGWKYDVSHRSVCMQTWYLRSVCLIYDPRSHTLDFSAPITSMNPDDLDAANIVCGQPVYGDDPTLMSAHAIGKTQSPSSVMLQPEKYVAPTQTARHLASNETSLPQETDPKLGPDSRTETSKSILDKGLDENANLTRRIKTSPTPNTRIPVEQGVITPVRPPQSPSVGASPWMQYQRHPHVSVTIRSVDDPYIYAKRLTGGTMDFGMEAKTGFIVGIKIKI